MAARLRPFSLLAALGLASWALLSSAPQASAADYFVPRRSNTNTLLADGSILVVGGIEDENGWGTIYIGTAAYSVQRLNENQGKVENMDPMAVNRASHTATLLPDGNVLVAGGYSLGGAFSCGGACNTFAIYDTVANNWVEGAALSAAGVLPGGGRFNHTASLTKNGRVLICGGENNAGVAQNTCDVFTPNYDNGATAGAAYGAIAAGPPLLAARSNHTATILFNGDIFVTGGYNKDLAIDLVGAEPAWSLRYLNTSERFTTDCNSPTGCWIGAAPLWGARANHTATNMADGKVLIAGGNNSKNEEANRGFLNTSEVFDPMANSMRDGPPMTARKASFAAALRNNGSVALQGGLGNIPTTYFDPVAFISGGSYLAGPPAAAGCSNPGPPFCDLGFSESTAALSGWDIDLSMVFQLDSPVTGLIEDGVMLFYNPRISFSGGTSVFMSGYVRNDDIPGVDGNYGGTRGIFNGANVYCDALGICGWASLNSITLIFESGSYSMLRVPIEPPTGSDFDAIGTDAAACIDFEAAGVSIGSPPSPIVFGNQADSPVYAGSYLGTANPGNNQCPGNVNSWDGQLTLRGFPLNTVGGRISSGTVFLEDITGTSVSGFGADYTLSISSMFAVIPRNTLVWETLLAGERVGAITFTANYRDINGTVSSDTEIAAGAPSPVNGSITLYITEASVKYVVDRIDVGSFTSAGLFFAGPLESQAIVRSMIFADFDEFNGGQDDWDRIPINTSGAISKFSHSAVVSRNGDLKFWGGRTCGYGTVTDCSVREVNPVSSTTLITYQETWLPTVNTMEDARGNHTATVLPGTSGYILVAGGTNGPSVLRSAEIYNPATRVFTPTGEMQLARDLHTAALLPNGKVLVAGGYAANATSTGPTNSAEIYYPREGVWRNTGFMSAERDSHAGVTLPDGNILVFGGYNKQPAPNGPYLASAEIYYSTIAQWRSIPLPTDPNTAGFVTLGAGGQCNGEDPKRSKHTASLLKNGEILFAGGVNQNGVLSSALLLNLFNNNRTKGWRCAARIGPAGDPRYVHSHSALSLPSGDILLTFGNKGDGQADQPPLSLSYNPAGDSWTNSVKTEQRGATYNHAAVVLPGGDPIIVGGARGMGQPQRGTLLYNRMESSYTAVGNMNRPRAWHTLTLTLGQELVAIGGYSNGGFVNDAEYYPATISNPPDSTMFGYPPSVRISSITSVDSPGAIYAAGTVLTARDKNLWRITEAAGGGHDNSSNFHPRMILQAVDSSGGTGSQGSSGYFVDLTTRIYHRFAADCVADNGYCNRWTNPDNIFGAEGTESKFIVRLPDVSDAAGAFLPNGWYNLRLGQNGLYSDSMLVRVGPALPVAPASAVGTALSTTSVSWTWPDLAATTLGYNLYYSSSGGYITSVDTPTPGGSPVVYILTGLTPNVTASIIVEGYSQTGEGPGTVSQTVFTLSTVPANIRYSTITTSGATVVWDANGNSNSTVYELSYSLNAAFDNAVTPTDELPALTTTTFDIGGLTPLTSYYLRIRAKNLAGLYSNYISSTIATRWELLPLSGTPCSAANAHTCIDWTWSTGTLGGFVNSYNIYNATIPSTAVNYRMNAAPIPANVANFTDGGSAPPWLKPNAARVAMLTGIRPDGQEWQLTQPATVYTWAAPPAQQPGYYHVVGGSASITVQWNTNGNPVGTEYRIYFATRSSSGGFIWSSTGTTQTIGGSVYMKQMIPGLLPSELYHASMTAVNEADFESVGVQFPADTIWGTYNLDPSPPTRSTHSAYTLANKPAGPQITNTQPDSVTITWQNAGNASSTTYEVSWSTDDPLRPSPAPPIYVAPSYETPGSRSFSELNNSLTCTITGLMTGTTYWFRVRAQNFDTVVTPEYSTAVSTRTPTGSASATTGQLGGVLRAAQDTTITGTIGNPAERTVSLTAPANAFTTDVDVVIATYNVAGAASLCSNGVGIGLSIVPDPYIQPVKPLTLTFSFTLAELGGADPTKIVLMRYDPSKNKCVPLPTVVDTVSLKITALINHLSLFQLAPLNTPTNPHGAKVFPNPFYKSRDGFVMFTDMPPYSRIRIYTLQGDLILDRLATGAGTLDWGGLNMWGRMVASGMYLAVIQHGVDKKILKVVVLR